MSYPPDGERAQGKTPAVIDVSHCKVTPFHGGRRRNPLRTADPICVGGSHREATRIAKLGPVPRPIDAQIWAPAGAAIPRRAGLHGPSSLGTPELQVAAQGIVQASPESFQRLARNFTCKRPATGARIWAMNFSLSNEIGSRTGRRESRWQNLFDRQEKRTRYSKLVAWIAANPPHATATYTGQTRP
jgi:hypothetical protein